MAEILFYHLTESTLDEALPGGRLGAAGA